MLNVKVVTQTLSSFTAFTFAMCVVYGLVVPAGLHPAWLLEAILPGFRWLGPGTFLLGLIESAIYGAWAGAVYATLYNYFARRAARAADRGAGIARAA